MKKEYLQLLPSISIIIPVLNESMKISACLDSIYQQEYPRDKIEVILVDAGSTDDTLRKARRFPIKIIKNDRKDAEIGKMIGLRNAKNNLFLYLDADIELVGKQWLEKIVSPLLNNLEVVGAFPRFVPKSNDYAIGRFLRYHPLELDPVLQFFCTEIKDTIVREENKYKICEFYYPRIPPIGICVYRKDILLKIMGHMDKFMDIDVPVILSKNGLSRFAYVPECGIYHTNVKSIRDIVKKRLRNITHIYLPNIATRQFTYFSYQHGAKNIMRVISCIFLSETLFFFFLKSCYRMFKYKDTALLYESVVAFSLTNAIIYTLLRNKEKQVFIRTILFAKNWHDDRS